MERLIYKKIVLISIASFLGGLMLMAFLPGAQQPRVIDAKDGPIVFMINGREQARIDNTGLYVRGNISYTGFSTDESTYLPSAASEKRKP